MSRKSQFIKIYANLPLGARSEIVTVVGNEPVTWNSAMVEIENNTKIGESILAQLISLGILNDQD